MLPIVQLPIVVEQYAPEFEDLFNAGAYEHFTRYLSGLMLSDNKTVEGINRLFVKHPRDQSNLNRFLTEGRYDIAGVNLRRIAWLQECPSTRFKKGPPLHRGCLSLDDTLLRHVGKHFEGIALLYDHVEKRYVQAHNLVTLHYSDDGADYPLLFQLWRPLDADALEEALLEDGVRIKDKKRELREQFPKKWLKYLRYLAGKNDRLPHVQQAYQSKLSIAQQLLKDFFERYPQEDMPITFDSWYTAGWFCKWIDEELGKAYVGTLTPDTEVFLQDNQTCTLGQFAEQLKAMHLGPGQDRAFLPITIEYKGKKETYYSYSKTHSIKGFGKQRLVINHTDENLSSNPVFYICNRLQWEALAITRARRHRWQIEVYHEEGKAEGLGQYQLRDFEAIHRHVAFIAMVYSMLQRARFDADLVAKLQTHLEIEIQGTLAFWRRANQAQVMIALIQWAVQSLECGTPLSQVLSPLIKATTHSA